MTFAQTTFAQKDISLERLMDVCSRPSPHIFFWMQSQFQNVIQPPESRLNLKYKNFRSFAPFTLIDDIVLSTIHLLGKCPCGQMSSGQMSIWANVFLGKCLMGKCLMGKCCSGQMSVGKCLWANVVWANVVSP
jgi:hypothetical protein